MAADCNKEEPQHKRGPRSPQNCEKKSKKLKFANRSGEVSMLNFIEAMSELFQNTDDYLMYHLIIQSATCDSEVEHELQRMSEKLLFK